MHIFQKLCLLFFFMAGVFIFEGCAARKSVEIKKAKIREVELAYYTRGNGEPLVMIMGSRGTMAQWDPALLNILERKYTLILFDNRGAGFSSDTQENRTTISQMAEDTANLIRSLGFKKVHVLGWSMGSKIALELVIKHPEIVDHLILCAPNPGGKHQAQQTSNAYAKLTSKNLSQKDEVSLMFPDTPEGREAAKSVLGRMTQAISQGIIPDDLKVSDETANRQAHAVKLWNGENSTYDSLAHINVPTLVADGLNDVLNSPENARTVANRIPFAWSAYFVGAGHDFLSQDYQHFADLVILFIESTK